ncbi:MAG: translocation/assembly module TamB domain-containing protein [Paracoccaceae bacterium]
MKRYLAYSLAAIVAWTQPLAAQDDDPGGPLVRLLENTLSNESRTIKVTGLDGALSSRATIEQIEVSDDDGVWFRLNGAVLDWNRVALVRGRFSVNELTADSIEVLRQPLPSSDPDLPAPEAQPFAMPELPVSILIDKLAVERVELGEDVVGLAAALSLDGRLTLADGALYTNLAIDRLDRVGDRIGLTASFANETRLLAIDLQVDEDAGGLISNVLSIPNAPPVTLAVKGNGPLDDFTADLNLATDGVDRVEGRVSLVGEGEEDAQAIIFDAKVNGDLRPLLVDEFDAFFGAETRLHVAGRREPDGQLDVSRLELVADALILNGDAALDAKAAPTRANLDVTLADPAGNSVVLPFGGGDTQLLGLNTALRFDAAKSADWTLNLQVEGLSRPDVTVRNAEVSARGRYEPDLSTPLTGNLEAGLLGLGFADAGLRKGVGDTVNLAGEFVLSRGDNLRLSQFLLSGRDYRLLLDAAIQGLSSGFSVDGTATAELDDLSRFDVLAGQDLAGKLSAQINGKGDPLGGVFDVKLEGTGTDLKIGQEMVDPLIAGQTDLVLDAERGPSGLTIRTLDLNGEALTLNARGSAKTGQTDLTLTAGLDDLGRILPDLPGPVTVAGTASQQRGVWTTDLDIDAPGGAKMRLDATVPQDLGDDLAFDLSLTEPAGGPVGRLAGIPGGPALALDAQGGGALTDFAADIALATEGTDRLSGRVTIREQSDPEPATAFHADVSGDASPFLAQQFHAFFGTDAQIDLTGLRYEDGRIDLTGLDVDTGALELDGTASLNAAGKPLRADIEGTLEPARGASSIRLPIPGDPVSLRQARVAINLDGVEGEAWTLSANVVGLDHPATQLSRLTLQGNGTLDSDGVFAASGTVRAGLQGLGLTDPALNAAVGSNLALDGTFILPGDDSLSLNGLSVKGQDMSATADLALTDMSDTSAFEASGEVRLTDLSRFSGLAKRPLTGKATVALNGTGALSDQSFDMVLTGLFQNITTGIKQADALLAGEYHLRADAASRADGVDLRSLILTGPSLKAKASGFASASAPDLQATVTVEDVSRILPTFSGPLRVDADVKQQGRDLTAQLEIDAPNSSYANAEARLSPEGAADVTFDARLDQLERIMPQFPGAMDASGRASRADGKWTLTAKADGPAGISAIIDGIYDELAGTMDATAKGSLQMAAANAFISPISVKGDAGFDLSINGQPSLEAVTGQVRLSGGAIAIPQIQNSVQNFGGTIALNGGSAGVDLRGNLRTGGSFTVNGPVQLSAPFNGDIGIRMQELIITDEVVYRSPVSGNLTLSGPLTGNARISGRIDVGETEIDIANAGGASSGAPIPDITHVGESSPVRTTRARAGLIETGSSGNGPAYGLDVLISVPRKMFVRGRGLDAELGGELYLRGTTANLAPSGQISLLRGGMTLFGRRLNLDRGLVTLQGSLQPYLEFAASSSTTDGSATLEISGQLDSLDINVTSDPELPEEEALALLIFGTDFTNLSPFKVAQIATGLLTLRGGGNFVSDAGREATGADSVSLAQDGGGLASLGLGGYISDEVYTDVAVNAAGDTELNINLDVTDNLTIKGTVDNAGDSGIGLFFDREY